MYTYKPLIQRKTLGYKHVGIILREKYEGYYVYYLTPDAVENRYFVHRRIKKQKCR